MKVDDKSNAHDLANDEISFLSLHLLLLLSLVFFFSLFLSLASASSSLRLLNSLLRQFLLESPGDFKRIMMTTTTTTTLTTTMKAKTAGMTTLRSLDYDIRGGIFCDLAYGSALYPKTRENDPSSM